MLVPICMYIDDLFHSPVDRIAAFAKMQVLLYRRDVCLQDYFLPLQLDTLTSARVNYHEGSALRRLISATVRGADKVTQLLPHRRIKADVLFCPMPDFSRKTEIRFLVRTLLGLADTDAKILCLLSANAPCRNELDAQLTLAGRRGQVTFLDPAAPFHSLEARMCSTVSRLRAQSALSRTVECLEPHGLNPGIEVKTGFERAAYFSESWERLAPWVEFDAVVARCHWSALCSPVCRTAQQRSKPVITFQQGVIGTTLDVPITASKYVAFGQTSASLMARKSTIDFFKRPEYRSRRSNMSMGAAFSTR